MKREPKRDGFKSICAKATADEGGLAQLARALDLHSRGQGFDSLILHKRLRTEEGKERVFIVS